MGGVWVRRSGATLRRAVRATRRSLTASLVFRRDRSSLTLPCGRGACSVWGAQVPIVAAGVLRAARTGEVRLPSDHWVGSPRRYRRGCTSNRLGNSRRISGTRSDASMARNSTSPHIHDIARPCPAHRGDCPYRANVFLNVCHRSQGRRDGLPATQLRCHARV